MSAGRGVWRDVSNPDVHVLAFHFRKSSLKKIGPFDRCCLLSHRDLTADQKQSCPKDRPRQNGSPHSGSPIALGRAERVATRKWSRGQVEARLANIPRWLI